MTAGTPADTGIPRDAEGGYIDGNALAGPLGPSRACTYTARHRDW